MEVVYKNMIRESNLKPLVQSGIWIPDCHNPFIYGDRLAAHAYVIDRAMTRRCSMYHMLV